MGYCIAITGASGQLGTRILQKLLEDPALTEVRAIDLAPPSVRDPRVQHHRLDIRDPGLDALFAGCDAVFHLAFVVLGYLPRHEFDAINVGGSENVFEAAARAGVPYLLYTSSIAAYGVLPGHPDPIDERTPLRHQRDFPYASAKFEVEAFLDGFERRNPAMKITRLRPVIVLGPGGKGPTDASLRKHLWVSTSRHAMPIVWENDVAQAAALAFQQRAHGAFLLAADEPLPGPQLAAAAGWSCIRIPPRLRRLAGRALARSAPRRAPRIDPGWLLYLDVQMRATSRKAREELGWKPECPTCADVLRRYAREVPSEATPAQRTLHTALDLATRLLVR